MCHFINLRYECGCLVLRKKEYCVLYPTCKEDTNDENWVSNVCPMHLGKPNPHLLLFGPADKRFWGDSESERAPPPFSELHAYDRAAKPETLPERERREQKEKKLQRKELRQDERWHAECFDRTEAGEMERQEIQRRELKRRCENPQYYLWK